jgi:hypothetical protein
MRSRSFERHRSRSAATTSHAFVAQGEAHDDSELTDRDSPARNLVTMTPSSWPSQYRRGQLDGVSSTRGGVGIRTQVRGLAAPAHLCHGEPDCAGILLFIGL